MNPLQRLYVEFKTRCSALDWAVLPAELHDERFFSAGPLMRALRYLKLLVLLIDELDKVDQEFEAVLLEVLSAWRFSISKIGTIKKPKFCSCGRRMLLPHFIVVWRVLAKALRGWSLEKPPSISEMLDLAQ